MTMTAKQWATLNHEWTQEVAAVVDSERLPWIATSCWCNQRAGTRCIELTHRATGKSKQVTLAPEHLATPGIRRAEIIRQLQNERSAEVRR